MFVMHDGELAGDDNLGGLCLQAIPSSGAVAEEGQEGGGVNRLSQGSVRRDRSQLHQEAEGYLQLFQSDNRNTQAQPGGF